MARSKTRSFRLPHAVVDALELQMKRGVIDYPTINAAVQGLMTYQLVVAQEHPLTSEVSRMPQDHQDLIYDFLLEMTQRGLSLKGSLLNALVYKAMGLLPDVESPRDLSKLSAVALLELARRWRKGDETVWDDIDRRKKYEEDGE